METKTLPTSKPQLQWDTVFSTYWWNMELNPSHPQNKGGMRPMAGYSKAIGHTEAHDKDHLLMRKVLMFVNQGYIQRTNKIEIYKRSGPFIDKSNDNWILTLYPNDFEIQTLLLRRGQEVAIFLKKVYNEILKGNSVEYLLPKTKAVEQDYKEDDRLDITKVFLQRLSDVQIYCEKLLSDGIPRDAVTSFYRRYVERKFAQR